LEKAALKSRSSFAELKASYDALPEETKRQWKLLEKNETEAAAKKAK
jgi:hypothetical protein